MVEYESGEKAAVPVEEIKIISHPTSTKNKKTQAAKKSKQNDTEDDEQ